jgi:beta-lactamase superfamily II metal-dependent hydrolase
MASPHSPDVPIFVKTADRPYFRMVRCSHLRPFSHPDPKVISALAAHTPTYRTDEHYHVTIETDGNQVEVSYSHV